MSNRGYSTKEEEVNEFMSSIGILLPGILLIMIVCGAVGLVVYLEVLPQALAEFLCSLRDVCF